MVRDVAFGQYFPANSVIHKCDPRAKLIMLVGFLVIIFCTFNYASLALVVLFTALFVAASKVPAKFYFKSMKVIIFIIIVTSILNVFYGSGDPLVQWGIFKITLNGINRAIFCFGKNHMSYPCKLMSYIHNLSDRAYGRNRKTDEAACKTALSRSRDCNDDVACFKICSHTS